MIGDEAQKKIENDKKWYTCNRKIRIMLIHFVVALFYAGKIIAFHSPAADNLT